MKYIYVLEDDSKLQAQILEALRKSEPQAQIRYFNSLETFQKWLILAMKEGQKSLFLGGEKLEIDLVAQTAAPDVTDELILLISKDEWLGSRYLPLIKKTLETFIRKSICTKEDPTRVVITAFESPDFDLHLAEDPILNNVLFKPFDELILAQLLHYAASGHHPPKQSFVHKVQTVQEVEMTKEVQMEAVGDVGFVTRSPRALKVGQISKYYGEGFKSKGRTHVMGRCIACEAHPDWPSEFRVWFSFFGIPSNQISDIRRNLVTRNEIEYSADLPLAEIPLQKDWIILDPNKDRVTKFKKILHDVVDGKVKVFSSFDAFYFQTDPNGLENNRKEKPWVDVDKITLQLDRRGDVLLKVFPEDQEKKKIFGEPFAELKKASFHSKLHELSLVTLKAWILAGKSDHELLIVHSQGNFFTLKVTAFNKKTVGVDTFIEIELTEPSVAERIKWFEEKFPTPQSAHGILIADEYLKEEKLPYWEEFVKKAAEQGHNPRFIALYSQVPDEKIVRKLNWVEDIYENGNDSPYIERKLKWRNSKSFEKKEPGVMAFLNSCKELIRVANPVAIAELSEAGLLMDYYRPLDVGAFRKFVLSKSGETFSEYRATCNYSVPHPTEKELFQSHFVFFGITDGHLKSIRVWILENYVHSKQEEG